MQAPGFTDRNDFDVALPENHDSKRGTKLKRDSTAEGRFARNVDSDDAGLKHLFPECATSHSKPPG